jgi:hypothetical protein
MKRFGLSLIFLLQIIEPTWAQSVLNIANTQAEGRSGNVPNFTVWLGTGLTLSFSQTNEHIVKAWLDDPSKLTIDFDSPLCSNCDAGATVIHLRRIKALSFAHLLPANSTLLTVITQTGQQKKVYYFHISYGDNQKAKYVAVNINSDIRPILQKQSKIEATLSDRANRIALGLKLAKERSSNPHNILVFERVTALLAHVKLGMSFEEALHLENLAPAVLDKLEALAGGNP